MDDFIKATAVSDGKECEKALNSESAVRDLKRKLYDFTETSGKRLKTFNTNVDDDDYEDDHKVADIVENEPFDAVAAKCVVEEAPGSFKAPEWQSFEVDEEEVKMKVLLKDLEQLKMESDEIEQGQEREAAAVDEVPLHIARVAMSEGVKILRRPRTGKKLLVLDVDRTIYDCVLSHTVLNLRGIRPHLHKLLEKLYPFYEIGFWLESSMSDIERKLSFIEIPEKYSNQIVFFASKSAMAVVQKATGKKVLTKPLDNIFKYFPMYDHTNTVICDDNINNLECNPQNGILVSKFSYSRELKDNELLHLMEYLIRIANEPDLSLIDHTTWKFSMRILEET